VPPPPEIFASTLCTLFWRSTNCWFILPIAGLDFLKIVGETLDLRGHGVETRAGICGDVLHGFLQGAHGAVELADGVAGLLDESFQTVWFLVIGWRDLFVPEGGK